MIDTTINCEHCGQAIKIDQALARQVEAKVSVAAERKHQAELKDLQASHQAEMEKLAEQTRTSLRSQVKKEYNQRLAQLQDDQAAQAKQNQELTNQLTEQTKELRQAKDQVRSTELELQKRLLAETEKIRQAALSEISTEHNLKIKEYETKIQAMQKSLDEAQRRSSQGSQQLQGEALELSLADQLRVGFPLDDIIEVKQGQYGADIKQVVKSGQDQEAGLLLWEAKNAKWQPAWLAKFKADIRSAKAGLGVLVATRIPERYGQLDQLAPNIWVVAPDLAIPLARVLRESILSLHQVSASQFGQASKQETLYQFITGKEFRHRLEAIIDNYTKLQRSLEKEKRAAALRWAEQEKAIQTVISNTLGFYGDVQGLTGESLPAIDFDK